MKSDSYSLEWSDYKSMPFTQCVSVFALSFQLLYYSFQSLISNKFVLIQVVSETLRVANIIGGVFRRATTDVEIKGKIFCHLEMKMCQFISSYMFEQNKKQVTRFQKGGRFSHRLERFIQTQTTSKTLALSTLGDGRF